MENFHEPPADITPQTREYMRALNSLKEEIEAIDWYQQRLDGTEDQQLVKILEHNRDEEMEHACMMLEWLRRNMEGWDVQLRRYLFTSNEITNVEGKP